MSELPGTALLGRSRILMMKHKSKLPSPFVFSDADYRVRFTATAGAINLFTENVNGRPLKMRTVTNRAPERLQLLFKDLEKLGYKEVYRSEHSKGEITYSYVKTC